MLSTRATTHNVATCSCSHGVALVLTMTLTSTSNSTSIFEDGKLKPGTYKVQNIYARTYLDVVEHSRRLCCRPAQDLEEGDGIVRRYPLPVVRV
jgi:hypothetical protein